MKFTTLFVIVFGLTVSSLSFAAVKLRNADSDSHGILTECGPTKTRTDTSIAGSSTRDIGSAPCTVTVKSSGSSASGGDGDTLVIKDSKVSK